MMLKTTDNIQKRVETAGLQRATLNKKKEKDAVFNLLGFQQQQQQQQRRQQQPLVKPPTSYVPKSNGNGKSRTSKARLKPPPYYPPKSKKRPRQTLEDLLRANDRVKPITPPMIPKVFLMDMGKKRKKHPTVTDQFENAVEPKQYLEYDRRENEEFLMMSPVSSAPKVGSNLPPVSKYQLLLEKQAEERRKSLARLTASRLKGQLFSAVRPDNDVNKKRSSAAANKASKNSFSNTKKSNGGIYDDVEIPTSEAKRLAASKIRAASRQPPPKVSIYSPSAHFAITIPLHTAVNANTERIPAFSPGVGPHQQRRQQQQNRVGPIKYEDFLPPKAWQEIKNAPEMPPVGPDIQKLDPILHVGPHDVLYGRGGFTGINPGNKRLRDLVAKFRMAYFAAPKGVKGDLSKKVLNYIRSKGGKFLGKDDRTSALWYEVGDEKAFGKCSQALRDGIQDLIKQAD
ncbi:unnamed protein product [Cylindrotheca closterium]|uniref:DUF6824 domain-containing protein n=1 Tax=Cylindrotheca closterium TaxID=2856 RepID=A0AAD2FSU0_9STRA|nr:unnamed protein product [Cylindrotheca closterium]